MINFIYEFASFCTSAIAKLPDGTIVHDRNLDFNFADPMRKLTYVAKFKRGDKELFESVMFAGLNGVYTGIKKGAFSISEDLRKPSEETNPI